MNKGDPINALLKNLFDIVSFHAYGITQPGLCN